MKKKQKKSKKKEKYLKKPNLISFEEKVKKLKGLLKDSKKKELSKKEKIRLKN